MTLNGFVQTTGNVEPVSPSEIIAIHRPGVNVPNCVIEAVNKLIEKRYSIRSNSAIIYKSVLLAELSRNQDFNTLRERTCFDTLFDFKAIYKKAGWEVSLLQNSFSNGEYWKFEKAME